MSDLSQPAGHLRIGLPGIYQLTAAQYHADPVIVPSFSRSIAKVLCRLSPAHARSAHPRLGNAPDEDEEPTATAPTADAKEARDVGTAAHAMFLRGEQVVEVVDYDSYRTNAARQRRDEILATGKVPLKRAKYDDTLRVLDVLENFRATTGAFTAGKAEQTLIWNEGETWCRAMVDWLPDDPAAPLWDLKTTSGRALVDTWTRSCFDNGSDLQAAFYPRGCAELREGEVPDCLKFAVVETLPPYGIKVFEMSPAALDIANEKLKYALAIWRRCQLENSWPGYSLETEWIDPPPWVLREWDWRTRGAAAQRPVENTGLINRMIEQGNYGG